MNNLKVARIGLEKNTVAILRLGICRDILITVVHSGNRIGAKMPQRFISFPIYK